MKTVDIIKGNCSISKELVFLVVQLCLEIVLFRMIFSVQENTIRTSLLTTFNMASFTYMNHLDPRVNDSVGFGWRGGGGLNEAATHVLCL